MSAIYAVIEYEDAYVRPLILAALEKYLSPALTFTEAINDAPAASRTLQISDYESLDLARLADSESLINAYVIRKALTRKHYLALTVSTWTTKYPDSVLKDHVKPAIDFELDYAEFLDDALIEAYELRQSFESNETKAASEREWWILKPGMSDRGQGIRLFSTEEELTSIFEEWDPDSDDEDEDAIATENGYQIAATDDDHNTERIMTSQLRHFVAQRYIHPPLLLSPPTETSGPRKFHIRTYVVAVGALEVYVYKPMLALFAAQPYTPPWGVEGLDDLRAHLTNTCLQDGDQREGSVSAFWGLSSALPGRTPDTAGSLKGGLDEGADWKNIVFEQICSTTGELFEAAARGQMVHFQPLPNAFEVFGLDFMVDESMRTWLLEVNAYPDFKQTGEELSGLVSGLWEEVVKVAIRPHFDKTCRREGNENVVQVLDIDLGRK